MLRRLPGRVSDLPFHFPQPPHLTQLVNLMWVWLTRLTQADTDKVGPLGEPLGSPEHKCYSFTCHGVDIRTRVKKYFGQVDVAVDSGILEGGCWRRLNGRRVDLGSMLGEEVEQQRSQQAKSSQVGL